MKYNYKTSLTKENFVNALNEIQLTPNELHLLEVLYRNRKQALTGLKLQAYLKAKSVGAVNLTLSRIAKKITNYTGVFPKKEEDGKYSWWSLLVIGEWLGAYFSWQLKPELAEALETLNISKKIEKRIARLCWNTEGWKKPSGAKAKSKNKNAYTSFFGFGWEEWLFDIEKSIDDYHYGCIQAINKHWDKYQNTVMNISLYSINGETKEKYWLGEIKEAEIITRNTAKKILRIYKKEGWLGEMKNQVKSINGDLNEFKYDNLFNLRYRVEHLNIFEKPIKIKKNDPVIKATYFGTLLYFKTLHKKINNLRRVL